MSAFGERCIELRKQGYTLSEIAAATGKPKTSVYYNIRFFPLREDRLRAVRAAHGARIRLFAIRRKGKSSRIFRKFEKWNADTVSLVSHLLFDGDMRAGCSYNNRNPSLITHVEQKMKRIYDFSPKRYRNTLTGVHRISYFNVALAAYMREKGLRLIREIFYLTKNQKRVFLRSFFDDEGCMDYRPLRNLRQIRGYQKRVEILRVVEKLLREFGVTSAISAPNEIKIIGKANLERFKEEIDFSKGVRINGERSNSLWGKSLEKRNLLRMAIASYKPVGSNGVHRS